MLFAVASASRSASSPPSATGPRSTTRACSSSLLGVSIPVFFLAILLKYVFAVQARLVTDRRPDRPPLIDIEHPTNFYLLDALLAGDLDAFWDVLKHLILPAIALGSIPLAIIARITRASVLDVQNEDYVRTARAKGLSPRIVDRRHVLRNALLPVVDDHRPADRACSSPAPCSPRPSSRWPGHGHAGSSTRSRTATTPCCRAGSCSSRSSSCSSTCSSTSPTRSSTRGSGCSLMSSPRSRPARSQLEAAERALARGVAAAAPQPAPRSSASSSSRSSCSVALFAPLIAPYDPREADLGLLGRAAAVLGRPREHPSASTSSGRDEFSRIVYGARYSLLIGVVSVAVGLSIGLLIGAVAGYFGGWVDSVIMRLMDIMLAIPGLLLAIGIVAVLGPGSAQIMIAVGVDQDPDLRPAATRIDPREARDRLRARGALGRRARTRDPRSRTSSRTRSRR